MKDLSFDVQERDLIFATKKDSHPVRDIEWGVLFNGDYDDIAYLNIIIPSDEINEITGDSISVDINVKTTYQPEDKEVKVRFVIYDVVTHQNIKGQEFTTKSYFSDWMVARTIKACQLPLVNINGNLKISITENGAYIFSSDVTDIAVGDSVGQESQLLTLCDKGNLYRYPTTGVGSYNYINSIPEHSSLPNILVDQFKGDGKTISDAEFDSGTGKMNVYVADSGEADDDLALENKLGLDISLIASGTKDTRQLLLDSIELEYDQGSGILSSNIHIFKSILDLEDTLVNVDNKMYLNVDETADAIFQLRLSESGYLYRNY